jgi:hypothetical protein
VGGNDLDIALAFKSLMPLLGMGANGKRHRPADPAVVERDRHQRCRAK